MLYDINIVANYQTILFFKKVENFKTDLGKGYIDQTTKTINIKDNFILFQMQNYNRNVLKYGKIGKINLYYNLNIKPNIVEFYFDTTKIEKIVDPINTNKWFKNTLVEIKKSLKPVEN